MSDFRRPLTRLKDDAASPIRPAGQRRTGLWNRQGKLPGASDGVLPDAFNPAAWILPPFVTNVPRNWAAPTLVTAPGLRATCEPDGAGRTVCKLTEPPTAPPKVMALPVFGIPAAVNPIILMQRLPTTDVPVPGEFIVKLPLTLMVALPTSIASDERVRLPPKFNAPCS